MTIDCVECEGYGSLERETGGYNSNGPWVSIFEDECPHCQGTGETETGAPDDVDL